MGTKQLLAGILLSVLPASGDSAVPTAFGELMAEGLHIPGHFWPHFGEYVEELSRPGNTTAFHLSWINFCRWSYWNRLDTKENAAAHTAIREMVLKEIGESEQKPSFQSRSAAIALLSLSTSLSPMLERYRPGLQKPSVKTVPVDRSLTDLFILLLHQLNLNNHHYELLFDVLLQYEPLDIAFFRELERLIPENGLVSISHSKVREPWDKEDWLQAEQVEFATQLWSYLVAVGRLPNFLRNKFHALGRTLGKSDQDLRAVQFVSEKEFRIVSGTQGACSEKIRTLDFVPKWPPF
jgi:hypothetical protein